MFSLERHERESVVWDKLFKHLQERLETMRLTLEATEDHETSQKIRGRIFEIRYLLALNQEPKFPRKLSPT